MSTLRCKPGDLAVVLCEEISDEFHPGTIVTVVKLIPRGTRLRIGTFRPCPVPADVWHVLYKDGEKGLYQDHELLPIRPEPDPEEQLHQVEVPTS